MFPSYEPVLLTEQIVQGSNVHLPQVDSETNSETVSSQKITYQCYHIMNRLN